MSNFLENAKVKYAEYDKTFKLLNGPAKCFMGFSCSEETLTVNKFIPQHGSLEYTSEGAQYGFKYALGLATLLNVNTLVINFPHYIKENDYKNIFYKYGFKMHRVATEQIARTTYETTFRYSIPKPNDLFQEFHELYFSLMDYFKKYEEEQQIKFNIKECNHTSLLPAYIIEYNYLEGKREGEIILSHNEKGFLLQRVTGNIEVYIENSEDTTSMATFFHTLIERLWESMM